MSKMLVETQKCLLTPECNLDALNFSIAIDNEMAKHWYALAPHKNVFVLNKPRAISDNISIPKPVVATMSNFLNKGGQVEPEKLQRFIALPEVA